ncbi:MAG: hypothetical protein RLZZ293_1109 [Pseudomonadota bacterium]|jgi:ATP-binding cassette subfamily F protein 3
MLQMNNLKLAYANKILLQEVNLQLYKGQIYGLVGKNGCGKSSLFKLILGINQPEAGEFRLPSGCLISHIEQEIDNPELEIIEYVLLAHHLYADNHTDLPEYYQLRPNAEKLLIRLGFKHEELILPIKNFSGGWQMRANLAKALFCPSEVLLLDEPTNHLDIETVIWLETWLKSYTGLAIVISHDREFLDNITTSTLHIAEQNLSLYGGNYSTFERTYAAKQAQQQRYITTMQSKIAHLQSFVDRFKAKASKAKQAQSRMKMIEKLQFSATIHQDKNYSIEFYEPEYTPDLLLSLIDLQVGYAEKILLNQVNLQIFAGDRIGLLGKNGKGKTSLIKAILEGTSLLNGIVEINPKIRLGYFAQQTIEMLNDDDTPYYLIQQAAPQLKQQEIFNYLGRFGFSAEIASQSIANFSGGEKARLILASIIITKPNILFLDEPTNHLDMAMREELATSLQDYTGAVVLVSHDKFLLQSVVDDLYLIDQQQLTSFNGSLDDYQNFILAQDEVKATKPIKNKITASPIVNSLKLSNKLHNQLEQVEKTMQRLTNEINQINQQIEQANQNCDLKQLSELVAKLEVEQQKLTIAEEKWIDLEQQIEQLTN